MNEKEWLHGQFQVPGWRAHLQGSLEVGEGINKLHLEGDLQSGLLAQDFVAPIVHGVVTGRKLVTLINLKRETFDFGFPAGGPSSVWRPQLILVGRHIDDWQKPTVKQAMFFSEGMSVFLGGSRVTIQQRLGAGMVGFKMKVPKPKELECEWGRLAVHREFRNRTEVTGVAVQASARDTFELSPAHSYNVLSFIETVVDPLLLFISTFSDQWQERPWIKLVLSDSGSGYPIEAIATGSEFLQSVPNWPVLSLASLPRPKLEAVLNQWMTMYADQQQTLYGIAASYLNRDSAPEYRFNTVCQLLPNMLADRSRRILGKDKWQALLRAIESVVASKVSAIDAAIINAKVGEVNRQPLGVQLERVFAAAGETMPGLLMPRNPGPTIAKQRNQLTHHEFQLTDEVRRKLEDHIDTMWAAFALLLIDQLKLTPQQVQTVLKDSRVKWIAGSRVHFYDGS